METFVDTLTTDSYEKFAVIDDYQGSVLAGACNVKFQAIRRGDSGYELPVKKISYRRSIY